MHRFWDERVIADMARADSWLENTERLADFCLGAVCAACRSAWRSPISKSEHGGHLGLLSFVPWNDLDAGR